MENKIWTIKNIVYIIILSVAIGVLAYGSAMFWAKNYVAQNFSENKISNNLPGNSCLGQCPQLIPGAPAKDGTFFAPPKVQRPDLIVNPEPNTKVAWNENPVKLPDLKLVLGYRDDYNLNSDPSQAIAEPEKNYYEMGVNGKNKIIIFVANAMDMGGPTVLFFEKSEKGYIFMAKMTNIGYVYDGKENKSGYMLSTVILSADTNTFYYGITGPVKISWKGLSLENNYSNGYPGDLFSDYVKYKSSNENIEIKKVDTISDGDLYLERMTNKPSPDFNLKFYSQRYVLKLQSGFYVPYYVNYNLFSDNYVPAITWSDGAKNTDQFNFDAKMGGCGGSGGYAIYSEDISSQVQKTGVTKTGENIYEFKDYNNPIVKMFYSFTEGKVYNWQDNSSYTLSLQEWASKHAVILYKNPLGEYAIFTNSKYGIQAECAKPVIYLYPEKPTNVKVRVGAEITKSEPEYNNGWNVLANPNGSLINFSDSPTAQSGKNYNYLFWDGTGLGIYPEIKEGFVAKQENLEATLKSNLKDLGLNEKESSDFMEFWLPKMPTAPFVRLTWFGSEQLNELAPLYIFPKPKTVIRVFLDFQGLEGRIDLPQQKLSSIERKGFTVVEWGGLLKK